MDGDGRLTDAPFLIEYGDDFGHTTVVITILRFLILTTAAIRLVSMRIVSGPRRSATEGAFGDLTLTRFYVFAETQKYDVP